MIIYNKTLLTELYPRLELINVSIDTLLVTGGNICTVNVCTISPRG